jgi:acetyl esterase/lipase
MIDTTLPAHNDLIGNQRLDRRAVLGGAGLATCLGAPFPAAAQNASPFAAPASVVALAPVAARRPVMRSARWLPILALCALVLAMLPVAVRAQVATPAATPTAPAEQPAQPATGPGGAALAFDGLLAQHYGPDPSSGQAPTGYWLFEPTRPRSSGTPAAPDSLPLILFFHGFDGTDPEIYHAWIDHLVRRGAILIYPDYQEADLPFDGPHLAALEQTAHSTIPEAIKAALSELAAPGHAQPDLQRIAAVGHSVGAVLAANYAGTAAKNGLPVPNAVFLAMPGCAACDLSAVGDIAPTTRVLVLVGNQDDLAGENTAKTIWSQLAAIPAAQRDYIRLIGDAHGEPPLVADHFLTATAIWGQLDAFDVYGPWKWFDALLSCSFAHQECQVALGDTPAQRFMGTWSDGVAVTEPQVTEDPGPPATPAASS